MGGNGDFVSSSFDVRLQWVVGDVPTGFGCRWKDVENKKIEDNAGLLTESTSGVSWSVGPCVVEGGGGLACVRACVSVYVCVLWPLGLGMRWQIDTVHIGYWRVGVCFGAAHVGRPGLCVCVCVCVCVCACVRVCQ